MLMTQRSSEPLLDLSDISDQSHLDTIAHLDTISSLGQVHHAAPSSTFRTLGRTFSRRSSSNYSTLSSDSRRELYADRYISLTSTHLTIKSYYFPLCTSCSVPINKIAWIKPGTVVATSATKTWGLNSNVWWARDMGRCRKLGKELIVVCCEDEWVGKGATVERDDEFWRIWNDLKNAEKL